MAKLETLAVLVVSASQSMRTNLRSMLDQFGLREPQFANSASTAIHRLRERSLDLVLCEHDLGEDNQDGQHLLEDLRTRHIVPPSTLFIMISGERSYERVVGTAEFAPDDYVLKPLTPGMLLSRIERALARRDALLPVYRLLAGGQRDEALTACEHGASEHPQWRSDFLRLQAETALELGRFDAAGVIYNDFLQAEAPPPWARLGHAHVLIADNRHDEAQAILEALITEHPHYLAAYDLLALSHEHSGQTPAAFEALDDAIRRSPRRLGRLRSFGTLATRAGEYGRAEEALKQVVQLGKRSDFRDPADHVELLKVQLLQAHPDDATATMQDLTRSMGHQPAGKVCAALGKALLAQHSGDEPAIRAAVVAAARSLDEADNVSLALKHDIVRLCLSNGLDTEGERIVGEILRHAPDEQTIRETRELLAEQGRQDLSDAVEARLHEEVKAYVADGARKAQAGDYDGAVSAMLNAVRKMPGNPHALFNAALALLRHIEHNGWNERLVDEARTLIARTRKVDPGNPRLDAMTTFMAGLQRKYGIQSHAPAREAARKPGATR